MVFAESLRLGMVGSAEPWPKVCSARELGQAEEKKKKKREQPGHESILLSAAVGHVFSVCSLQPAGLFVC